LGSTIKHFAAYSYVVGGKDYNSSLIDSRTLKIKVMRPYEAGIEAGALAVMPGFNDLDGIPCVSNKTLLDKMLRKKWGFDGVIVSDYGAIKQNIIQHYENNGEDAAKGALEAGTDIDMESRLYIEHLSNLIKEKQIEIETLNKAVFRILKLKSRLGLFDSPFTDESREYSEIGTPEALDLAYEAACKSIVLLKNQQLLPLQKPIKIALIGPYANTKDALNGSWAAHRGYSKTQTIIEGFSRHTTGLCYSAGIENDTLLIDEVQRAVDECDVIIAAFGIENCLTGEAASLSKLQLPEKQMELFHHLQQFEKPIVALLMSGRPLIFNEIIEQANAVIMGWSLGTRTGDAIADTIFGINNPSGKLTMTFPRTAGQCPIPYNGYHECRPYQKNDFYTATYRDINDGPLFPFGYGISYNHYCYSIATLKKRQIAIDDSITIDLEISNEGKYLGREIIQVYVTKCVSQPLRPRLELVYFQIENFKPHEKRTIHLTFPAKNLCYEGENNHGIYQIKIGPNSSDLHSMELEII
ncbi:MAG: glycoside hydrolase family 3 C-terminal domain-containing protein, partial [Bacilli bacterium]|nr:glycoside hydrolase family 3 C-terminal domain-containing protein [Bacilli bacterium]